MSTLQDYAKQYARHVEAFPSYLRNALELCTPGVAMTVLAENLAEEDGTAYGTSHPELWLRFAEGLGVSRSETKKAKPRAGIQNVVACFAEFSRKGLPEALGALYAYESQVPEIAASKIDGLKRNYGIRDERALSFFEVHREADILHRESLLRIIETFSVDERERTQGAIDKASQALWDFLTDVDDESKIA